jgi:hypothetical protein
MDTSTLLTDIKARFAHNSAKQYLTEKYNAKLIVADQGGLWRADRETLTFLVANGNTYSTTIMIDTFGNPVKVDRIKLITKLTEVYTQVMEEWHKEWQELETKR